MTSTAADRDQPAKPPRRPAIRWGRRLEHRRPGARFGIVLGLLLVTFAFMAAGLHGDWVPLVTVILQGVTLLAALAASEALVRIVRISAFVIAAGLIAGIVTLFHSSDTARGLTSLISLMLVALAPGAIGWALIRRRRVDLDTVLGAICVYVLLGMLWAFAYATIGYFSSTGFFAQHQPATTANTLYFSFITLTTVGYGDFTPASGLPRAAASLEALSGQLYLVTVVALVVSQLAGRRSDEPHE